MPFALDTLPETFDDESNDDQANAQKVKLPIIINGRAFRDLLDLILTFDESSHK